MLFGEGFKDALEHALAWKDHVFVHAFDDDDVIAGQGTIGLEILDDLERVDTVFVPVGGGGLIAGISTAVKALSPATRVIGVQTESAPSACIPFGKTRVIITVEIRRKNHLDEILSALREEGYEVKERAGS